VANALKFTSEGFVELALKREKNSLAWKDRAVIAVRDSGCGVKSGHEALFSKWEMLGSQTNGSGIGLCLSQALVRAMGGEILFNKDYCSGIPGHPVSFGNHVLLSFDHIIVL
jgi:signal transduction histidine kinase